MTDSSRGYQQFFAELKRRKVFRVMAAYGVIGFGVIEASGEIFPRVGIPDWAVTLVVWLALLGFPIAVVLAWAFESSPDGMKRTVDATSEEIEEIIAQPVSKRWTSGLLALAGVALLFGGWWMGRTTADSDLAAMSTLAEPRLALTDLADDSRPSIAVLPFVNMSADEEQEHFSDGMTEEILNVLAKIKQLRVAARTSTFALKDRDLTAAQWGDTLNVRYFVEGSVRKAGDQVRITAQLIDTVDGSHLWTEAYTRPLVDVFEVQAEIAEAISVALAVPLALENASSLVTPTADVEAYDLYLAGRASLRDRPKVGEAITLFEAAIARDSTWAPAWASLAEAIEVSTWYKFSWDGGEPESPTERLAGMRERQRAAEVAALRAIDLDPSVASAHVALGSVYRFRNEWDRSEAEYLKALAVDPDNAEALQQYAEMLSHSGRFAEGVRLAERALSLDPTPVKYLLLANILYADARPDEALARLQEGMDLFFPDSRSNFYSRTWYFIHLEAGRYDEMLERGPSRHIEAGDSILQALAARDPSLLPADLVDPSILMVMGRPDAAAELLLEVVSQNPGTPAWIFDPVFDPIRDHPAFQEALSLVNLVGVTPQRTTP